jgi:hypothetical protein
LHPGEQKPAGGVVVEHSLPWVQSESWAQPQAPLGMHAGTFSGSHAAVVLGVHGAHAPELWHTGAVAGHDPGVLALLLPVHAEHTPATQTGVVPEHCDESVHVVSAALDCPTRSGGGASLEQPTTTAQESATPSD